jgi:hypothetical protein
MHAKIMRTRINADHGVCGRPGSHARLFERESRLVAKEGVVEEPTILAVK